MVFFPVFHHKTEFVVLIFFLLDQDLVFLVILFVTRLLFIHRKLIKQLRSILKLTFVLFAESVVHFFLYCFWKFYLQIVVRMEQAKLYLILDQSLQYCIAQINSRISLSALMRMDPKNCYCVGFSVYP